MSKPDRAVLAVVDTLKAEPFLDTYLAFAPSIYAGDLAQRIVDATNNLSTESHPEWEACREQTEEEVLGLFESATRAQAREYLSHRRDLLERYYP